MMTREERILNELNKMEQMLKVDLQIGDEKEIEKTLSYVNGMKKILTLLGYKTIEDENKSEFINECWIYTYKAIEDARS